MKSKNLLAMLLITAIAIQSCNSGNKNDQTAADTAAMDHVRTDTSATANAAATENGAEGAMFMENAAIAGMLEVEMGKIGQQRASKGKLKDFAMMIEKDHTIVNAELKVLAKNKGMQLPASLPMKKQENIKDLNHMSGSDFDKYYINMMVEDHITAIALFKGAGKSPDTAISRFAGKILPVLEKHYKQARELSTGLK